MSGPDGPAQVRIHEEPGVLRCGPRGRADPWEEGFAHSAPGLLTPGDGRVDQLDPPVAEDHVAVLAQERFAPRERPVDAPRRR